MNKKTLSVIVSSLLLAQQTLIASSLNIDINAPKENQATIDNSRNNVPIVNIIKPNYA